MTRQAALLTIADLIRTRDPTLTGDEFDSAQHLDPLLSDIRRIADAAVPMHGHAPKPGPLMTADTQLGIHRLRRAFALELPTEGQIGMGLACSAWGALTDRIADAPSPELQAMPRSLIYAGAFAAVADWAIAQATERPDPVPTEGAAVERHTIDTSPERLAMLAMIEETRVRVLAALTIQDAVAIFRPLSAEYQKAGE